MTKHDREKALELAEEWIAALDNHTSIKISIPMQRNVAQALIAAEKELEEAEWFVKECAHDPVVKFAKQAKDWLAKRKGDT